MVAAWITRQLVVDGAINGMGRRMIAAHRINGYAHALPVRPNPRIVTNPIGGS